MTAARTPVRAVIFDFGGVLVNWRPQEIIDSFYEDARLRESLRTHAFQHDDWLDMDRGTLDEASVASRCAARMARPEAELRALFDHAVFAHLERAHDFFGLFDGIVVSAAAKLLKPEPAIYEHLRERFDLHFDECIFIDDLHCNVESARRCGLPAIRFETTEQVRAELLPLL